ncbi:hypothetical protein [Pectobacterium aquaticum]|uniref:hypothetical protein n=1 Tax=Pectobacterium aquaticum TaxID=2204145 RepID=UPI0016761937|nr:hypothetical protein [Pectobacterium aquaticum]
MNRDTVARSSGCCFTTVLIAKAFYTVVWDGQAEVGSKDKKKPTKLSAWYESIVLCSNSKKEVRQYGAQRPSLDVAFTCGNDSAAQQGKKC